ncbi:RepB family plasmid replication initiator protein, partial [Fructilactobacillus sanfranciscensis]
MSNEIVKYGNALNSVAFRKFNAREMNLFFSIVSRMRDK